MLRSKAPAFLGKSLFFKKVDGSIVTTLHIADPEQRILNHDRKIREVAKLVFSRPSVERLFERFLKKEGFSEKPGTTKSLSVEAALYNIDVRYDVLSTNAISQCSPPADK
jgi:hypothetical protein